MNNSEDGTELMKCTNWWKTERVFCGVLLGYCALWYMCVPTFRRNLLPPFSGLSNLVLVGNIVETLVLTIFDVEYLINLIT